MEYKKLIIGIDPGIDGAIAILSTSLEIIEIFNFPVMQEGKGKSTRNRINAAELFHTLKEFATPGTVAVMERESSRPGNSAASAFAFGTSYGIALGVLAALGIGVRLITPTAWKKALGIQTGADKGVSVTMVNELYPAQCGLFRGPRGKALHDRAEAVLIARAAVKDGVVL